MVNEMKVDEVQANAELLKYDGWQDVVALCKDHGALLARLSQLEFYEQAVGNIAKIAMQAKHDSLVEVQRYTEDRLTQERRIAEREAQEAYDRQMGSAE